MHMTSMLVAYGDTDIAIFNLAVMTVMGEGDKGRTR